MWFVFFEVVRFTGFVSDATEGFAQLADKHVLHQSGWNSISLQQLIQCLNLFFGHAQTDHATDCQLPFAQTAMNVIVNPGIVFVAQWKRGFHVGFAHTFPI